jgi:hypothetical protein
MVLRPVLLLINAPEVKLRGAVRLSVVPFKIKEFATVAELMIAAELPSRTLFVVFPARVVANSVAVDSGRIELPSRLVAPLIAGTAETVTKVVGVAESAVVLLRLAE